MDEDKGLLRPFTMPVTWAVSGDIEVMARSFEEAVEKALDKAIEKANNADLPEEAEYVDSSFEVNHDLCAHINTWKYRICGIE